MCRTLWPTCQLSNLASDCGITHNTAKAWLTVLEASYVIYQLQPHHQNFNKRLVRTPKLYFFDTGLATWLLGIQKPEHLRLHPLYGALFENWVVSELLKKRLHKAREPNLFFWRDRSGHEVDILIDQGHQIIPLEIKAGQTIASDYLKPINRWIDIAKEKAGSPLLIYGGTEMQKRSDSQILPWKELNRLDL